MLAGHEELEEAEPRHFERGAVLAVLDVDGAKIGFVGKAVSVAAAERAAAEERAHGGIVDAADDDAPLLHAACENAEGLDDGLDAAVVLEMVGLDVRDDGDLGVQLVEGAVVFIRFDDEE